jgi:predicted RNA-binding protein associated with RNAse of E/G family
MITVIKNDHRGQWQWEYTGKMVARGDTWIQIEAYFNRDTFDAGYVIFRRNDRFVEWFYSDRCYNVFRIYDALDGRLKGWYCNITRPAIITDSTVAADDLALDVFVAPDGTLTVLDEDEFAALPLSDTERRAAENAVDQIRALAASGEAPFHPD